MSKPNPQETWNSGSAVPDYVIIQPARILIPRPISDGIPTEILEIAATWRHVNAEDAGTFEFILNDEVQYRSSHAVLAWRLC